jgi:dTDP-4-amino-4,6-dideoxygalactose transaminase
MEAIRAVALAHGLAIVEDAAQAMGASYRGQPAGRFGAAAAFSAHPLKLLAALGDAGFLATDDADLARKVALHRTHGLESRDHCVLYGVNSRLDELQAAILELRLARLPALVEKRRRHAHLYREILRTGPLELTPAEAPHEQMSYTFFNVFAPRRDELRAHLAERGIETLLYYGTPLHLHPAAEKLGHRRGDFPVAEEQCDKVLALPHHQYLDEAQIAHVADAVNAFYAGGR